jgi:hypothetical protein
MGMSNRVAIMQPTYLPWLGYFALMRSVDTFIILDDVQFERRSWQQRNRIVSAGRELLLTVPTLKGVRGDQAINSVNIDISSNYNIKHLRSIFQAYSKSKHFDLISNELFGIYEKGYNKLIDLNMAIIELVMSIIEIKKNILYSSDLMVDGRREARLINICKAVGASEYVSPVGAKSYLESGKCFSDNNLGFEYFEYQHPKYSQLSNDFISNMSIVDLIFNEGKKSIDIL